MRRRVPSSWRWRHRPPWSRCLWLWLVRQWTLASTVCCASLSQLNQQFSITDDTNIRHTVSQYSRQHRPTWDPEVQSIFTSHSLDKQMTFDAVYVDAMICCRDGAPRITFYPAKLPPPYGRTAANDLWPGFWCHVLEKIKHQKEVLEHDQPISNIAYRLRWKRVTIYCTWWTQWTSTGVVHGQMAAATCGAPG